MTTPTTEAVEAAAKKYGVTVEFSTVAMLAGKGRAWLVAEAARLKAAPDHPRKAAVLAAARVAWEVSK